MGRPSRAVAAASFTSSWKKRTRSFLSSSDTAAALARSTKAASLRGSITGLPFGEARPRGQWAGRQAPEASARRPLHRLRGVRVEQERDHLVLRGRVRGAGDGRAARVGRGGAAGPEHVRAGDGGGLDGASGG